MKKKLLAGFLTLFTASLFCWGNPQVTLTVLDYQNPNSSITSDENKYIWDAFEEAHPNIKIEREPLFEEDFYLKAEAYASYGRMPDVFYMWPAGRSSMIQEKKLAKDLTPFLKKDGIYDNYNAVCILPSQQKSGYVAEIPLGISTSNCMLANTKVLRELGLKPAKTYEELKEQLPILKRAGKELIIMANSSSEDWVMQKCLLSMVLGRLAGPNWAQDILDGRAKFTDAPFKSAVQMIKTMYDDGVLSQQSLSTPYAEVIRPFAKEKGAYLIDGDWRVGAFLTDPTTGEALIPPTKQESDIELIQFPVLPGEKHAGSNSGTLGGGYAMSSSIEAGSAEEAAAWELIKWLSGPECQQRRFDNNTSYPSLEKGISFENCEPLVKKRVNFYCQVTKITPDFDDVFSKWVTLMLESKLHDLGEGSTSVDNVCKTVQWAFDSE